MTNNVELIQKLRNQTGAGMMAVKSALDQAGGDESKAVDILRKKGQKIAAKKQNEREAKDGLVAAYIHASGKVGAMIVLACETDFVAKNEQFKNLAHEIAMQVAAMRPEYVSPSDVPADVKEKEMEIYKKQLKAEGKPQAIWDKIAQGKLDKFYASVCLLNQPYIKDDKKAIEDLINEATMKLGEKIEVKQMIVFTL
ncbi:elongation factor Ts [Candidatus Kuenenbacteria bacterium CG_4_9_14_3_um_filter_39_14]|uniref:Elongation factor Ts n=6 Tax=Candidatus Kueneniibacteriota TaxID=1752740 RepID=A0A2M7IKY4_9BACT|nr:elongation factor Ts [Candidatus Kuenenbacteria bacterium]OIP55739.1 MAG: elongation factor Ts [Candidatus Kuenenbacteria bacterium CG2_30_39_24]PIP75331.1 MAG: elongation factor Ts [Candidatus Kuenenbacteria bacterium CG22_combo_CG10-13_8_21_14_all_39_9]PIR80890.1 MAG: elongation factor Ts [Candidatus Kuenenbacteria bacterium CG10_big_fil_rev_8_21_14_0_10_39_14]PIW95440.1 MAG: elongation factor Ts [Candidatus Kuenenbacteria bacterium CG_4_8_14_3_um_filter_39_15]PIX92253.1 MAG: elongation f